MKIKWKFEEDSQYTDEYGNLKSYYKNSEPWKKPRSAQSILLQIAKIACALVVCGIIILIAFSYQGYDWNESGFRYIRDVVSQRLGLK